MRTQKEPQAAAPIAPGTLTMLLTDVEGSTKLWEEHPDTMRRAIQRHHELAHQAIERYGGYRPRTRERATASSRCSRWHRAPWPAR